MKSKNIIFPLSPDPTLRSEKNAIVTLGFLKGALKSKRIHNIAVTGGFGTGKSSLIRSYEKREHINRFLYVSVGEYTSSDNMVQQEDSTSLRAIERRLLLQIFARFRRADLPQSSFRLIPESWKKCSWLIAIFLGSFIFSVLLLIFHQQLGALLVAVNSMEGCPEWGARIMTFLVEYKTRFRLLLSAYCIVFGSIASMFLCIRILPRIQFHEFKVKGTYAEVSLEREAAESYLDHYSMELVYCLEKIAGKIDHVVVFEDLDRLDPDDCLYILTRLREINNLANLRLQKKGQHLRFIYVVNDNFLETVQHDKFFDYILPVIPEMNKRSASVLFAEKIKQIDSSYDVSRVFPRFETVASCLSDYRLQNTILNEYQVLQKLYVLTKRKDSALDYPQKNQILAFAIYKNCWPGDYHALREGKSQVFTSKGVECPNEFKGGRYEKLLEVLTDQNNQLLTLHSLYYIGFSEEKLSKWYQNRWNANMQSSEKKWDQYLNDLNSFCEGDANCIEEAGLFLIDQISQIEPEKYDSNVSELFRGLISCVTRCKYRENLWFTRRKKHTSDISAFPLEKWLELLSILKDDGDEGLKNDFTSLFLEKVRIMKTRFCDNDDLRTLFLSSSTLKELCRAIPVFPESTCFYVDDYEISNPEKSEIVKQIRRELAVFR